MTGGGRERERGVMGCFEENHKKRKKRHFFFSLLKYKVSRSLGLFENTLWVCFGFFVEFFFFFSFLCFSL